MDQALEEEKALSDLCEGIASCEAVRDFVSRDLLLTILESEEEHVDFLDRQSTSSCRSASSDM